MAIPPHAIADSIKMTALIDGGGGNTSPIVLREILRRQDEFSTNKYRT